MCLRAEFSAGILLAVFGRLHVFPLGRKQLRQPDKIVSGEGECELSAHAVQSAQHGLGGRPDGLAPAERLLDPLTDALTDGISGMPRCTAVDGRSFGLGRHMRRHIHGLQFVDEVFGVVSLVSAQGDADRPVRPGLDHGESGVPLGVAIRAR